MPAASDHDGDAPGKRDRDDLLGLLGDLTALVGARSEADVLGAAVDAACRATASRRGVAGRFDGAAATSDGWYEVDAGWTRATGRWATGETFSARPPGGDLAVLCIRLVADPGVH